MGKSSKDKVKDFDKWNNFLKEELSSGSFPKGFQSAFQSSSEWVVTFIEVIAVNSAIYGIVFSLVLCLGSVAVFTANFFLTLIVMITILGMLQVHHHVDLSFCQLSVVLVSITLVSSGPQCPFD